MKRFKFLAFWILALPFVTVPMLYRSDLSVDNLNTAYALPDSSFVEIAGVPIHYRRTGEGPKLLLIHGQAGSTHTWDEWIDALSKNFEVIALDLPGNGLSGPFIDRKYEIKNYTALVDSFMETIGVEKSYVIGHSLGGYVAWRLAANYPHRVRRLVMISSIGFPREKASFGWKLANSKYDFLALYFTPKFFYQLALRNVYAPEMIPDEKRIENVYNLSRRKGSRDALMRYFRESQREFDETAFDRIRALTLIITGDQDRVVPPQFGPQFLSKIRNSKLVVVEGGGHMLPHTRQKQLFDHILPFVGIEGDLGR